MNNKFILNSNQLKTKLPLELIFQPTNENSVKVPNVLGVL